MIVSKERHPALLVEFSSQEITCWERIVALHLGPNEGITLLSTFGTFFSFLFFSFAFSLKVLRSRCGLQLWRSLHSLDTGKLCHRRGALRVIFFSFPWFGEPSWMYSQSYLCICAKAQESYSCWHPLCHVTPSQASSLWPLGCLASPQLFL